MRPILQVIKWKQDIDQKVLDASSNPVPVVLLMVTNRNQHSLGYFIPAATNNSSITSAQPRDVISFARAMFHHAHFYRTSAICPKTRPYLPVKNCSSSSLNTSASCVFARVPRLFPPEIESCDDDNAAVFLRSMKHQRASRLTRLVVRQ